MVKDCNIFYLDENWDEKVMGVGFSEKFIYYMKKSLREQAFDIDFTIKNKEKVYAKYRKVHNIEYKKDSIITEKKHEVHILTVKNI